MENPSQYYFFLFLCSVSFLSSSPIFNGRILSLHEKLCLKGEGKRVMGRTSKILRAFVGSLVFLGVFSWSFFVGNLTNHDTRSMRIRVPPTQMLKHLNLMNDEDKHTLHWVPKAFYVSKRRVPNGPDPIHNRYICLCWLVIEIVNILVYWLLFCFGLEIDVILNSYLSDSFKSNLILFQFLVFNWFIVS